MARWTSMRTLLLAAAVLAVGAAPAAAAGAKRARPTVVATCGVLHKAGPGGHLTTVDVLRSRTVSCAKARRVVGRCIAGTLPAKKWRATSPNAATVLSRGKVRVAFHTHAGPVPRCVDRAQRFKGVTQPEMVLQQSLPRGVFGPGEAPRSYPDRWPNPTATLYEWQSPATTNRAAIPSGSVSTVDLSALVHNPDGSVRSAWFEWGVTRDLGTATDRQAVPVRADHSPATVSVRLTHLRAGTRYWWRAAANLDTADGGVETRYGVTGSFVTNPYPKLANPSRPCQSAPTIVSSLFELTESLAIDCVSAAFSKGACFPACTNNYTGRLTCDRTFPRNLNAGSFSLTVPKIGITISVDDLVSYWRSNNSNRFITLPGYNKNSAGGDVGPVPGWHQWDVAQWAYPFTSTSTRAEFWIHCTEKWGRVIDESALAAGEGSDRADVTAPGVPQGVTATATEDGGIDVSWQPPTTVPANGLGGYTVILRSWRTGAPREFEDSYVVPLTTTGTTGRISAANVDVVRRSLPAGSDIHVAVGAISREGRVGTPATVPWPRS